jgi:CYTH domain-containing protein
MVTSSFLPYGGEKRLEEFFLTSCKKKGGILFMVVIDKKFGKYAHPEVERKFLLATIPSGATFRSGITDHYIPDTTLRLRRVQTEHEVTFKLAQKLRVHPHDTRVILHTNFYLSESEYVFLASMLPSHRLEKRRFTFHGGTIPMGIDQFQGYLAGLVIAEVDFGPNGDSASLALPSFALAEVTDDERFTGARLALTTHSQVKTLLDEFNVK